jgi:hypothetical protein
VLELGLEDVRSGPGRGIAGQKRTRQPGGRRQPGLTQAAFDHALARSGQERRSRAAGARDAEGLQQGRGGKGQAVQPGHVLRQIEGHIRP